MTSGYGETSQEWGEAPAPENPVTKRTANAAERIDEGGESLCGRVCYGRLTETLLGRDRLGFYDANSRSHAYRWAGVNST